MSQVDLSNLLSNVSTDPQDGPIEVPLDLIMEDSQQPRKEKNPGFSEDSLKELAVTIEARGVKTPISLRINPEKEGTYIINHGARRFRASILAGRKSIPAFIDNDYNEVDQVIENIQRDKLTTEEIAIFVKKQLEKGYKKIEIAKLIGKSNAFITQHAAFNDMPEPLKDAYDNGKIVDLTILYELSRIYKEHSKEVNELLTQGDISRSLFQSFKQFIKSRDDLNQETKPESTEPNGSDQETKPELTEQNGSDQETKPESTEPNGRDQETKPELTEPNGRDQETKPESTEPNDRDQETKPELTEPNDRDQETKPEFSKEANKLYFWGTVLDNNEECKCLLKLKATNNNLISVLLPDVENGELIETFVPIEKIQLKGVIHLSEFLKISAD